MLQKPGGIKAGVKWEGIEGGRLAAAERSKAGPLDAIIISNSFESHARKPERCKSFIIKVSVSSIEYRIFRR